MDVKVTMSFEATVIEKAKRFVEKNNMSLSRLTEFLYQKITNGNYSSLEDFEIADWVNILAEGPAEYTTAKKKAKKSLKKEYFQSKR